MKIYLCCDIVFSTFSYIYHVMIHLDIKKLKCNCELMDYFWDNMGADSGRGKEWREQEQEGWTPMPINNKNKLKNNKNKLASFFPVFCLLLCRSFLLSITCHQLIFLFNTKQECPERSSLIALPFKIYWLPWQFHPILCLFVHLLYANDFRNYTSRLDLSSKFQACVCSCPLWCLIDVSDLGIHKSSQYSHT